MKAKLHNIAMSLFATLITVAPLLDATTRCIGPWGEAEYPNEKDYS